MLEGVTNDQVVNLLKNWTVGFVSLDTDFRLRLTNAEIDRIDGRTMDEMKGRPIWEVWPNVLNTDLERLIRTAMDMRKGGTAPLYRTTRPGRVIFLEVRVQPWGEGVALFVLDLTRFRELESEKEEIEQRYMLASKASLDIQYEWDIDENVWRSNGGHESLFGPDVPQESPIANITAKVHPDDLPVIHKRFSEAVRSGAAIWEVEYRVARDGGWVNVRDRAFIMYDDEGKPVRAVGVMKDVTESEKSQQEIQRLQSELIHVSRVSAMGTMASVLAHELNQPLAAIGSYLAGAERLLEDAGDIDRELLLQAIRQAHEGSARAGKIIQRLRSMTKKADHQREWTSVAQAIDNAVSLALIGRTHLRKTLDIQIVDRLVVQGDAIQLEQVFLNLIRNALEANEEAGRSGVRIVARPVADDMVGITISDHGDGIVPDQQAKLFDFFVSTKEDGMGIGLPISRTIIEAHGGKINVENREPFGATFRIVLPVSAN